MLKRSFSTSARVLQAKVFPKIQNAEELAGFLRKSTGNVHDMIPGPTSVVDSKIVRKMLRLSGLESDVSPELEQKWMKALNTQIGFINQLQNTEETSNSDSANAEVFRLIADDHQLTEALDLTRLMQQVRENQQQNCDEQFQNFDQYIRSSVKM